MGWLLMLLSAGGLLIMFAGSEAARRHGLSSETTRRIVHAAGAGTAATFPLYLQLWNVLVLSLVFTILLALTWITGHLPSIHAVARPSLGAVLFPVGLGLTALMSWNHPVAFVFAALVLALADPIAAVAGSRLASPHWVVPGGTKSAAGSTAFFLVAAVLAIGLSAAAGTATPSVTLGTAAILTAVEGGLGYGLDNLPLPIVAAVAGAVLLGL